MSTSARHFIHLHLPTPAKLSWKGRFILSFSSIASIYLLGFAAYISTMPSPFTTLPDQLDGLAVFTGGAGRVNAALLQLSQGFEGPVLISGGHHQTSFPAILKHSNPLTFQQQSQLFMDIAQTTRENITSVQVWSAYRHLHHIGIITSTYHAARVKLLSWWHLPNLKVTVLAVQPEEANFYVIFSEYNKLLATPFLR